ncbi:hypothetical protein KAX02_05435 [candidate division WOR-3 bacterium]|nr:hypothetical protein [candidate division WOR-3 bacterium]
MTKKQWENTTKLLKGFAKSDCRKCYGRGYIGREVNQDNLIPCKCVDKKKLVNHITNKKLLEKYD